jgi:hypothetical protein
MTHGRATAAACALACAAAWSLSAQTSGQSRTELTLGAVTFSLTYDQRLEANAPTHRPAIDARTDAPAVRIGTLETAGPLRVGDAAIGRRSATPVPFEVWLAAANGGWALDLVDPSDATAARTRVTLARQPASMPSPQLVAALVPDAPTRSRLRVRWDQYEAAVDIAVAEQARPLLQQAQQRQQQGQQAARRPNTPVNRAHDADNSAAARTRLLSQRNESALVLGRRFSVTFQRAQGARAAAAAAVAAVAGNAQPDAPRGLGPDYERLASTRDGAVVELTLSAVPRLVIEAPIQFGKTIVRTGNHAPGFPGSYGLWLKRAGSGWRLVFNHEPDVWGTQHDPKRDAAEVPLEHVDRPAATGPLAVALVPAGVGRGQVIVVWGSHEWRADFTVAP